MWSGKKEGRREGVKVVIVTCSNKKCKRKWDYQGLREFNACCPTCKRLVPITRSDAELKILRELKEEMRKQEEEDANT